MSTDLIKKAFDARSHAQAELRSLYTDAADRALDAEEVATEQRLSDSISGFDARIKSLLDGAESESRAADAYNRAVSSGLVAVEHRAAPVSGDLELAAKLASGEVRKADFAPTELRTLSGLTSGAGGATIPTTLYGKLIEAFRDVNTAVRANANVVTTSTGEPLVVASATGYPTAALVAEAGTIGASDAAFTTATLNAYKYAFLTQVSNELLRDGSFDLVEFLARQGGVSLGNALGTAFITGTGTAQPQGITNGTIGVTAASATTFTFDEVIDLEHSIVQPYRKGAVFVMSDAAVKIARKLKDSTGQYLWQPGLTAGQPDLLHGYPVVMDNAMPAPTAGLKAIAFGNFAQGYTVRVAGNVRVERSDDYAFNTDLVTFRIIAAADGRIVDSGAFRLLRML